MLKTKVIPRSAADAKRRSLIIHRTTTAKFQFWANKGTNIDNSTKIAKKGDLNSAQ